MPKLSQAQTRNFLLRAAALLGDDAERRQSLFWGHTRKGFLTDLEAALGVSGTNAITEALTPLPHRGQDRKKRKSWKPKEKPIDQSSGSVPVSPLSRTDQQNPDAGQTDDESTADQIAAGHTAPAPHFQPLFA